jgi:hypothetical protein
MKTFITVLLLFILSIAGYAQSLDGNWKGKLNSPNGEMNLLYTFKVTGDSLSGSVTSDMGSLPLLNGKVKGNEFSFNIDINGQVISSTGVMNGDKIQLKAAGGMDMPPFELTRVTNESKVTNDSKVTGDSKINGTWKGKATSPQGEFELSFTFKVDGDKLTGKNSSAMGDIDLTNGTVNGNDFSFDIEMQGMKINHKCKYLSDDSIEVKANVMDQDMVMKLTRANQ